MKKHNGCGGEKVVKTNAEKLDGLSMRQQEVLELAAMGLPPNAMPSRMAPGPDQYPVTVKAVRSYLVRVCEAFGVSSIDKVLALQEVQAKLGIDESGMARPNVPKDPVLRRPYHQQPMGA
ncbi:MAG: hypothetical protein AAB343_04275 [Patescibacteria group bacterium]